MSGTFYIKELTTPDAYTAPETDKEVALAPGSDVTLTGENAIVNEKGVVITLTKYNKPYAVTEGRGTLDGAEFTLYHMSASGSVKETFPAQTTKNGRCSSSTAAAQGWRVLRHPGDKDARRLPEGFAGAVRRHRRYGHPSHG